MTEPEPDRVRAAKPPTAAKTTATAAKTTAATATGTEPRGFLARRSAGRVRATPQPARSWRRYLVLGAIGLVLAVVAFLLITSLLPVWWAGTVGRQAANTISGAIGWGVFYGFMFTFVPLLIASLAFARRWKSVGTRLAFVIAGVLLAVPNLITLGITVGTGSAAHAAERTLDVQAPFFARTVLISAIGAAFLAAVVWVLSAIRQRAVRELTRLRAERDTRGEIDHADDRAARHASRQESKAARERTRGRT